MIGSMIRKRLLAIANKRPPDVIIGGEATPYMRRWWLIPRNRRFNVYLHHFMRSDDDRALHDHPWWNASLLLKGSYREIVPVDPAHPAGETRAIVREAGALVLRPSGMMAHRIELLREEHWCGFQWPKGPAAQPVWVGSDIPFEGAKLTLGIEQPVWTLFITGPNVRTWGFWCPKGWVPWREFTNPADDGRTVGRGCGEL